MALRPVRFDTWGGWVWVNMDPDAKPLREYLGSVPQFLDPYEFETCKIAWHKTVIFPCNWKTVLEAFNEGYHVEGTHTQITKNGWQPTISRAYGDHGWFGYEAVTAEAGPDAADTVRVGSGAAPTREVQVDFRKIIYEAQVEALETLKCLCSEYSVEAARRLSAVLPADAPYPQVAAKNLELHQQLYKELGIEWPKGMTPQVIQEAGTDWHVFPNQIGLPAIDGIEWYRLRPNGDHPESCIFDVWWLQRYPEGKEPPIQHDFYPTPDDFRGENPFLEQDFANLIAVQQGMHSRGFDGQRTNPVQELAISNFHRALHRYLGLDQEK